MEKMRITILLIVSLLFVAVKNNKVKKDKVRKDIAADSILQKMSYKLNSLKTIGYDLIRELNYPSEKYHNEMIWRVYLDLQSMDTIIGFKYQIEDEITKQVFNGTEKFETNKKEKTIKINDRPTQELFSSISAFYNSIITLKNALPLIIADNTITKTIGDTTMNDSSYYLVTLYPNKRRLQNLGKAFDVMTTKSNIIYRITIDKKTYLPYGVLQINDVNNDFIKTKFMNINANNSLPSEFSWYYSSYTNQYKSAIQKKLPQVMKAGSYAQKWILPLYNKAENVSLSQLKGKVVLLDFWIKNCGPCIKSIPYLNALQNKFKDKKFEIIGINSYDSKEDISWFCNKYLPNYRIVMQGKAIAEKYGVNGFPALFLIDKEGKFLFADTGFDTAKIEKIINKAL